jgi:hypothetical protein
MNASRKDLPPPDDSGTDPDSALRQRFSLPLGDGQPTAPGGAVPGPFSGAGLPGQLAPSQIAGQRRKTPSTRPDPEGMRRASYYISREAAGAMDAAVAAVMDTLGTEVPKHVALSALIMAGAERAAEVATALGEARTAALADRLKALQSDPDDN